MDGAVTFSLQTKRRVASFDSVDSSFDVVSIGESIEECIDIENDEEMNEDADDVDHERDDRSEGEWEELAAPSETEDMQVEIELDLGFQDAITAALDVYVSESTHVAETPVVPVEQAPPIPVMQPTPPRRRSAREMLRDFYLARAKSSEERSKLYSTYEPKPLAPPAVIARLCAPQRYDVEMYERVIREENQRKAQQALHDFYAQRNAVNALRAAENRANEQLVYDSQIGSSRFLGLQQDAGDTLAETNGSCSQSLFWETTRFVMTTNSAPKQITALSV